MLKSRRRFFPALLLACALFCLPTLLTSQQTDPFYSNLLEKAQKSFLAKDYAAAARDFEIAAFGLAENKILRAKAYVYLGLSRYYLKDIKASEQSIREAAAIMGQEGFAKLEIYESAWPDLEKLMSFFNIVQSQSAALPKEVEKPRQETDPKTIQNPLAKKPAEKAAASQNPAEGHSPGQPPPLKLDEIKEGDVVPLALVDTPPAPIKRVAAIYPSYRGASLVEGTVTVRVLVSENGDVIKTEIVQGMKDAFGFDRAALLAVRQWKFEPASIKGIKVKVWVSVGIEFRKQAAAASNRP
jgi:TonB family protein